MIHLTQRRHSLIAELLRMLFALGSKSSHDRILIDPFCRNRGPIRTGLYHVRIPLIGRAWPHSRECFGAKEGRRIYDFHIY